MDIHTCTQFFLKRNLKKKHEYFLEVFVLTFRSYWHLLSSILAYVKRDYSTGERKWEMACSCIPSRICTNLRTNDPSSTYYLLLIYIIIGFQNTKRPSGAHYALLLLILPWWQLLLLLNKKFKRHIDPETSCNSSDLTFRDVFMDGSTWAGFEGP